MTLLLYPHIITKKISGVIPGAVYMSASPKDTEYSLVANGRAVDIDQFPELFEVLGHECCDIKKYIPHSNNILRMMGRTMPNPNYKPLVEGEFYLPGCGA